MSADGTATTTVSALVVTRPGRIGRLTDAVRCFAHQTHPSRELVVVHDGNRAFDADVRALCRIGTDDGAVTVRRSLRRTLGSLRNLSVEVAGGDVVCQWDDDDLHHPRRIADQLAHMRAVGAAACLLSDQLHLFEATSELYWDDWTVERFPGSLIPGTLLADRAAVPRYPRHRRGEDTAIVTALVGARRRVRGLQDAGWLYVYVLHGDNAFDAEHHRAISSWKHRGASITGAELADLDAALREYPVAPRPVVLPVGARRVELTLGGG